MAALLRSARFLKLSPSGLLQITGSKRNGPPLGRLYSGVACSRWTGVLPVQGRHVCDIPGSRVWPHTFGCLRNYVVATEKRDEVSMALRSQQAQQFDWALTKLDSSVRRTGRITKTLLLRIFHDICRKGYPSGNQALLLLRSCGSLLPEMPQEERTELAHRVWDKLQELGAQYDVSHYNALLKVYLQNEFKFSPTDFLAKMEAANIHPNRVTYQRLIAAYCHNGDIEGASTILGFMKSKDMPIAEAVFSSLITGHARTGDIESAKNILSVMRGAGIEPGPETYLSLLIAFAETGDMENIKKTLEVAENADCGLMDRDIMQLILTLARFGHQQLVPEITERLRHERRYIPDAMNLCLNLITLGQEDTAFHVLKTFPSLQSESAGDGVSDTGNFFLRHCVNIGMPLEKIVGFCKELQDSNYHSTPLPFVLHCALEAKKMDTSFELMKLFKERGLPVRPHFFWPLLTQHSKDNNVAGVVEVLKGMKALSVSPDTETISSYILPAFPSTEAARQAFQDADLSLESERFVFSEVRSLASSDLAGLYNLLSDPSYSPPDLRFFLGNLMSGFKKSSDVESMVKITTLLRKDERFSDSSKPIDPASYFLYNLIVGMSEEQLQTQEDKLRSFFNQLKAENFTITQNIFRGIRKVLMANHVPELTKDIFALVNPAQREAGESGAAVALDSVNETGFEHEQLALEKKLAELKAENKSVSNILRQLLKALSAEERVSLSEQKLQHALKLKQQHEEEMTSVAYAILINLCCRHNNVEEAMNLKREMSRKDSSFAMSANKYLALVKALVRSDRLEEAVDILREMKEKEVVLNDTSNTAIFHLFSTLVSKGDFATIRHLQHTIFTLGLAKPTSNLCSPLVTAYLESNDVSGALDAALECQKRYSTLPRIHDVIVALVEKGDTDLLQKAMDFVSQERGEMVMLYDLFFAFLQTGRYKEARKIIETPGLRAKPGRLQWYAEKCIYAHQMEALEQMVNLTEKLFECDRDEMYSYILRLCKETNDWQKAEATWMKMQEENVIPRERTLCLLAHVLKTNGQEVPFEVPESWYEHEAPEKQKPPADSALAAQGPADYETQVLSLCKKKKAAEAYKVMKEAEKNGVVLKAGPFDILIRALLAKGSLEEALAVKDIAQAHIPNFMLSNDANSLLIITYSKRDQVKDALEQLKLMLQLDQVPLHLAITRLVQAMGNCGDVDGIQEVQSLIKNLGTGLNFSSMVFVNNTSLAHIQNGNVESAVELLEGIYMSPDCSKPSMSFVFRKVMEADNGQALDKLSAMAERLANHFACYRPASDLFLELLESEKYEEAKFMLARVNAIADQKEILLSYLSQKSQSPGQKGKIQSLLNLIPDFAEKEVMYTYLMKSYVMDKDLVSAKALHEQMQKEMINVDELSLKRLARLYQHAGETAPFPEPPESFNFYAKKLKERAARAQAAAVE